MTIQTVFHNEGCLHTAYYNPDMDMFYCPTSKKKFRDFYELHDWCAECPFHSRNDAEQKPYIERVTNGPIDRFVEGVVE